jgi:tryptophan-rich sensory protein
MVTRSIPMFLLPILAIGAGFAISLIAAPGVWHAGLTKPAFAPPPSLFTAFWAASYLLIAIVGWRVSRSNFFSWAMGLWWLQLLLNLIWLPTVFAAHLVGLAFMEILFLLAAVASFIAAVWSSDRVSALLLLPYVIWIAFVAVLNGWIFAMN